MKSGVHSRGTHGSLAWLAMLKLTILAVLLAIAVGLGICPALARDRKAEAKKTNLKKRLEQLRSLPYATTSPEEAANQVAGVSFHDSVRACRGYNLYFPAGFAEAVLMDMAGKVVHRWTCPSSEVKAFNHVNMLPSGDLLAISETFGLVVLDWDSNLLLEKKMPAHHDVARANDSTYYVLSYETKKYRNLSFRFDSVVQLSACPEISREWSTYGNLDKIKAALDQRSFADALLDSMAAAGISPADQDHVIGRVAIKDMPWGGKAYDYFHLNTLTILPDTPLGREDRRFRAGNILTCARNVNQILVLDQQTFEILWAWGEGVLQWPHHPTMLASGNILVFDNGVVREYSSVVEIDPVTERTVWQYVADPPEAFYTSRSGSAQRLPNGNTFVCESEGGRGFEITPYGEMVWEWLNPALKDGHRVTVYRMARYSPEVVEPLLAR